MVDRTEKCGPYDVTGGKAHKILAGAGAYCERQYTPKREQPNKKSTRKKKGRRNARSAIGVRRGGLAAYREVKRNLLTKKAQSQCGFTTKDEGAKGQRDEIREEESDSGCSKISNNNTGRVEMDGISRKGEGMTEVWGIAGGGEKNR